jgi:hypothetical protein
MCVERFNLQQWAKKKYKKYVYKNLFMKNISTAKKQLLPYLHIRLNSHTPECLQIKCKTYISWIGTDAIVVVVVVVVVAAAAAAAEVALMWNSPA